MEIQLTIPKEALTANNSNSSFLQSISVSDKVFSVPFNEPLIHQAVTTYLANSHLGQKAQKSRAQVKGSTAKPWRQKGTGRARAGSVKSPLWRGGGVTFAAKPQKGKSKKLNRKMYQGALRSILSELYRLKRLLVVEQLSLETPKTQALQQVITALGLPNLLIVLESDLKSGFGEQKESTVEAPNKTEHTNIFRAARNLPKVSVLEASRIDPVSLIQFPYVVMTVAALKQLEEQLNHESKSTLTSD